MNKIMRKVVAFAAMAAMAVPMIPTASAAEYLLIDNVDKLTGEHILVRPVNIDKDKPANWINTELKDAVSSMSVSYSESNNTLTIKKLPSTVPYIRPYEYCTEYQKDNFNYAPYLPLVVNLGFFNDEYKDISAATEIKVDGELYALPGKGDKALTLAQVAFAMMNYTKILDADSGAELLPSSPAESVFTDTIMTDANFSWGSTVYPFDDGFTALTAADVGLAQTMLAAMGLVKTGAVGQVVTQSTVYDEVRAVLGFDTRIGALRTAFPNDRAVIDEFIEKMATNAAKAINANNTNNQVAIANALAKGFISLYAGVQPVGPTAAGDTTWYGTAKSGTSGKYFPIHVYHNLRTNPSTHTIEVTIGGKTYKRSFTVVNNTTQPYSVAAATRTASINYENMLATAENGNLFIQYSMKDLIATDTWGSLANSYKLWDRSNFSLSGTWIGFKDSVKQGDTVFFGTNVTLKNEKGETIPAGTKLELTFSKAQLDNNIRTDYAYQYSNVIKNVEVKADGSIDFNLALDKYDMQWLYNGHQQNYVQVSFTGDSDKYFGTFYVKFSARDRIASAVSFAEGTRISVKVGETKEINAILTAGAMSSTIKTWASAAPSIATVAAGTGLKANVTGVTVGSTVVTATTPAGEVGQIIVDVVTDTPTTTGAKTYKVVTTSSALNVRSGPATSYSIIGKMPKGTTFQGELTADGGWVKLTYVNQTGYVSSKYVIAQ